MPVPEPEWLSLCEAVRRVTDRCSVSILEAKTGLERAFREFSLALFDPRFKQITDWEGAVPDWKNSSFRSNPHANYIVKDVRISRQHLDHWIAQAASAPQRPPRGAIQRRAMPVGYIPEWWPLLTAIEHVRLVSETTISEAAVSLNIPLREGKIKSRYRGQPLGGIAGHYEGWGGEIAPEQWYRAQVYADGSVEFIVNFPTLERPFGLGRPRHHVEVWRADVLRYWPEPADPPTTGKQMAATALEPQGADAADAFEDCGTVAVKPASVETAHNAVSGGKSRSTVSYDELKVAIEKHGRAPEARLVEHAKVTFPEKKIPRKWVRRAQVELWGKPKIGRPKASDKSPE
jgi:hypothetical protein